MPNLIFNLRERQALPTFKARVKAWLRKKLIEEKLLNPIGVFFLILAALFIAVILGLAGTIGAMGLLGLIIGLPLVAISFFNIRFGLIFLLFFESFSGLLYRLATGIAWGVVVDAIISLLVFGVFVQQIGKRNWSFVRNPITFWLVVWIFYNIIQVANPTAASRLAWVFTVRSMALSSVLYFVALYAVGSLNYVTVLFKILILISVLAALYGLFQEYVFYPQYDLDSFIYNPRSFNLMFQGGKLRKFSFFGDPVVFGVTMSYMSIFCYILSTGPFAFWKRSVLQVIALLCAFAMFYSGTRTAYVLIPIGFIFYVILSHKKNMLKALVVFGFLGAILIFIPTTNPTIYRFQTAFKPSDDASFNVRVINQRRIKPFIQTHPMGGGLGSTGEFGKRFSPGTFLANFPPDSGFVHILVELGWIGLIIYFAMLFVVLREGTIAYFRCTDLRIKTYYACFVTILYVLCVASYPQEVFTIYPTSALLCIIMAAIARLKEFDPAYSLNVRMPA